MEAVGVRYTLVAGELCAVAGVVRSVLHFVGVEEKAVNHVPELARKGEVDHWRRDCELCCRCLEVGVVSGRHGR